MGRAPHTFILSCTRSQGKCLEFVHVTITIDEVRPGVRRLALSSRWGRMVGYEVSAYLLHGVLVDSGFPRARSELLDAVRSLAPRGIVVTHWHEDHAGNAPELAALGVGMLMHQRCEQTLREHPPIRFYRRSVWGQSHRLSVELTPFDPSPLQLIESPGHTPDHLVVWDAERRILASGDLFLGVKVRVAHEHESPALLLKSLRLAAGLEPRILLDAHRGVVPNAAEMLLAKVAWMEETIGAMETLAAAGAGEREIQLRVLGREALVGRASFGEYSKRGFVRAALADRTHLTGGM